MKPCDCHHEAKTEDERRRLYLALLLNFAMFVIGLSAGLLAHSTALIADSLDMLADSFVYGLGLIAIGGSRALKDGIVKSSGTILLFLGISILLETVRRAYVGSSPESTVIIAIACLSLAVNVYVLRLLSTFKNSDAHLKAAWIFTRADVIANLGVIVSGIFVWVLRSHYPDLIAGFVIGLYVVKESLSIFRL